MKREFGLKCFILLAALGSIRCLSNVPAPSSISQKSRNIAFSNHLILSNDKTSLIVQNPVPAGTTLIEWHENVCLTADAAYSDMDVGLKLQELAPRIGPGFDLVAIATLLGAEYIRNFQTRPSAYMPEGGDDRYFTEIIPSKWSEVTRDIWENVDHINLNDINPELEPLIDQGVQIALPILDATMRRAWSSGQKGRKADEIRRVTRIAFHLMLRYRQYPFLENGRWGWHEDSLKGPALLPFIHNILINGEATEGDNGRSLDNALLRCPLKSDGGLSFLQCVARRNLVVGENINIALD